MRRHISQREARRLKKRVDELEEQASTLRNGMAAPRSGVLLFAWDVSKDRWYGKVEGALAVGKVVVVRIQGDGKYYLYAC